MSGKDDENGEDRTTVVDTVITGVDIPFSDLVELLIKLALAAIPASIIRVPYSGRHLEHS